MLLDSKVIEDAACMSLATAAACAPLFGVCPERTRLWCCLLHVDGLLGWSAQVVLEFSEAVTARHWEDCCQEDLLVVIAECRAILLALGAKLARQRARVLATGQPGERRESDGPQE